MLRAVSGKLPVVRFGSTETCLQVLGTPLTLSEEQRLAVFERGWSNTYNGKAENGYYIGQCHQPGFTQAKLVQSVKVGDPGYMKEVAEGAPGLLICRGRNVMKAYVDNPTATAMALHGVEGELEEGMVGEQRGPALNRQITLARSLAQLTNKHTPLPLSLSLPQQGWRASPTCLGTSTLATWGSGGAIR